MCRTWIPAHWAQLWGSIGRRNPINASAIVGASERLRTMFRIARVDDILVMYPTLEEAQQKLAAKAAGN